MRASRKPSFFSQEHPGTHPAGNLRPRLQPSPRFSQPWVLMHAHGSPSSPVNPEVGGAAGGSRASHHQPWDFMHHKPPGALVPPPMKWVQVTVLLWGRLKGVVYTHSHAATHRIMKLYTELQIHTWNHKATHGNMKPHTETTHGTRKPHTKP